MYIHPWSKVKHQHSLEKILVVKSCQIGKPINAALLVKNCMILSQRQEKALGTQSEKKGEIKGSSLTSSP